MMPLAAFVVDFLDGSGPLTFYARRTSLGEEKQIEAVRRSHWEIIDGEKTLVVENPIETITATFLIRARDSLGARMFFQPADVARVWSDFSPKAVIAAVNLMNALDDEAK